MLFNFFLANHHETSLNSLGDLLEPIWHGLIENGHRVIRFGSEFHTAPMVNVMLEFFTDDAFVDDVLRMKREQGDRFVLGLVCTEDPEDRIVMDVFPNRLPNLERLLAIADFVWALLPVPGFYERMGCADRTAVLHYGFSPAYLDRDRVTDASRRDVDAVLYGNEHEHRAKVAQAIRRAGYECFVTRREYYPSFMTDDLIRRAKILIDMRRGPGVRFLSPTRIVKGLHSGTSVVSERFDTSEIAGLYRYTTPCDYAELGERCVEIIRSGRAVDLGLDALERFRAETSMKANMARLLQLPALARLAAETGGAAA